MLKRLLYVTPFALLPATEGHRKRMMMTLGKIREQGYQVDILFISKEYGWSDRFNRQAFREMQALADNFFHVHQPTPGDPAGAVYGIDEWWSEELDRYCEWLFANNGYETVFCNYVFMSRVFEAIRTRTRKLLETHDVFTGRKEMLLKQGLRPEFFYTSRIEERKGIKRADTVIAIKDEEAEFFQQLTSAEVVTLPFVEPVVAGVEEGASPRDPSCPVVFGFFGSGNSLNVQAIGAFADHLARSGEDGAGLYEVHLYGSVCNRLTGPLPAGVKVMGLLDEPAEFYRRVDCVVNFQEVSTGLKIKIAEALSFGAPLISLAHAFEGFGRPAHPAQACDGLPALVAQMRAAAADPGYLAQIAQASRAVERALVQRTQRMAARLFGSAETDPAMLFVVDGALYARSAVYRHLVASFRLAFIRSWGACLFLAAGEQPLGEFRAFADGFGRIAGEADLSALAPSSVLLLFRADGIEPDSMGRFGRVVLVEAACDLVRPGAARQLIAATSCDMMVARGRGSGPAGQAADPSAARPQLRLSLFRWMPWDLALAQRPQHFARADECWVFGSGDEEDRLNRLLRSVVAPRPLRVLSDPAAAHHLLFETRTVPVLVVAVGPCDEWALALEWLTVTGIEVRRFDPSPLGQAGAPRSTYLQPVSALVQPPRLERPGPPQPLGDWHASGWSELSDWLGQPGVRHAVPSSSSASLAGAVRVAP